MSNKSGRNRALFVFLLAAVAIGVMFVMSRTAKAADVTPGAALVAQTVDIGDSSRLGGARAGIGRPGINRPGINRPNIGINRPNIGINRPNIGVRPPLVRPPIRPIVPIVNEVNVVDEEEVNVVVCDEELLLLLDEECFVD